MDNNNHSDQDMVDGSNEKEEGYASSNNLGDEELNDTRTHITDEEQDPDDLEDIKERVREMEDEAEKLRQMQGEGSNTGNNDNSTNSLASASSTSSLSAEEKMEIDSRSVYVGNVDYSATGTDLEKHFHGCGSIKRVTILADKYNGHPKGFAYIEFSDKDSVETASALDNSFFKGRNIRVMAKRTNRPGLSTTNRPPRRGAGTFGRGRGYVNRPSPYFNPRGIRRGFRSRGSVRGFGW